MLKHSVKYTDPLTNEEVTETLHFNLSQAELASIVLVDESYGDKLKAVATRADPKELLATIKDIIRRAYGEVVELNGRKIFRKSDEISDAFMGTEAFSTFFMELFTDPEKVAMFVNGVMPKELMQQTNPHRPVPQDHLPKEAKSFENVDLPQVADFNEARAARRRKLEQELLEIDEDE